MTDSLHYIFLEVGKCQGKADAQLVEKIGYALYNLPMLSGRPAGFDEEIFDLLFSSADLNKFAPEDKVKYENDMTTDRDIQNQIDFTYDKGSLNTQVQVALSMLEDNMDKKLISKYTGLSEDQILALK